MSFKGAIFDLDGVIVDTVPLHFKAWKRMFNEYGKEFTFEDYKEKVDGIPRMDGARAILTDLSPEELNKAAAIKQGYYLEALKSEKIPVYDTTISLIKELRQNKIKTAVISSSKNCSYILKTINLYPMLDGEVNGNDITKGKPDPQIFLMAADKLKLQPAECVVFEDAFLGVESAKRAGMVCVGIDRHEDPGRLEKSDTIVKDLGEVNFQKLSGLFKE
jgi:beta-phosphoglucomutase